jgi:hypothetical protein
MHEDKSMMTLPIRVILGARDISGPSFRLRTICELICGELTARTREVGSNGISWLFEGRNLFRIGKLGGSGALGCSLGSSFR